MRRPNSKRGLLNDERKHRIRDAVAEIADDLSAHQDNLEPVERGTAEGEAVSPLAQLDKAEGVRETTVLPDRWREGHPVLCIPGVGLLDEAVAFLVAQLVERRGIGARSEQPDALSLSRILSLDTKNVALICLCYLGNATGAQIGYAIRRVRRKAPGVFIVVSLLGNATSIEGLEQHGDLDVATRSLQATIEKIVAAAIRLEIKNYLPDFGSPSSVAVIEKSPRKSAKMAI